MHSMKNAWHQHGFDPRHHALAAGSGLARTPTTTAPVAVALTGLSIEVTSATVQSTTMGNKLAWQVNGVARRSRQEQAHQDGGELLHLNSSQWA